jgi:hypothetical protein
VPGQRACGGEPPGVTGLGQDRGGTHRRQPGDRGDQCGQPELIQDPGHPQFGLGEPGPGEMPVLQQQLHPLQCARPVRDHPGWVAERGEQATYDPQARLLPAAADDLTPDHLPGPGRSEPPGPGQVSLVPAGDH